MKRTNRLMLSLVAGVLAAPLLTFTRGSWRDAPAVIPIFAGIGFSACYIITCILQSQWVATSRHTSAQHPRRSLLRHAAAIILVSSAIYWSGIVIISGGFGGWIIALFLGITLPLLTCLLVTRWHILFGLLAATSIAISVLIQNINGYNGGRYDWDIFWRRDFTAHIVIWGILTGLSLLTSVPMALSRRKILNRMDSARAHSI